MSEEVKDIDKELEDLFSEMTKKERLFCERYVCHFNGGRAAREAKYSEASAYVIANENLKKPKIKRAIEILTQKEIMSIDEGLVRMSKWSRGTVEPFLTVDGDIDLTSQEARDSLGIIKKIKQIKRVISDKEEGENIVAQIISTEIELHDAKDATKTMLEIHGKLIKRQEITGKDGKDLIPQLEKLGIEELEQLRKLHEKINEDV